MDTFAPMNYSTLVPVLQIVLITVLALIEVAPARTGEKPANQPRMTRSAVRLVVLAADDPETARAPVLRALVSARDLGEHGYSSKLHLNSE